jgi:hypothetical protein
MEDYRSLATRVVHRHQGFVAQYQLMLESVFSVPTGERTPAKKSKASIKKI